MSTDAVFVTSDSGRTFYLGTSSNWSFTRRLLNLTQQYADCSLTTSSNTHRFDAETYELSAEDGTSTTKNTPAVPTVDYAIHLVNMVKFHCGQVFHLFDQEEFMRKLCNFYAEPRPSVARTGLWYIHFLLILAFGKALVTKTSRGRRPPGADFFCAAMSLLPEPITLWREPEEAIETLCCTSLYFQSIDHRSSAYNHIGQALRLALSQGMHTDTPPRHLDESLVQRWRRIWWTVYVLDKEMTSLMGLPPALSDEHARSALPTFDGDAFRTAAFLMRIKLSQFIVGIDRTGCSELLASSETARNMLSMCLESSLQIITIITALDEQDLLETFLPFDLEALHTSATNIIVASVVLPEPANGFASGLQKAFAAFDRFSTSGNLIAQAEQAELRQLQQLAQQFVEAEAAGPPPAGPAETIITGYSCETPSGLVPTRIDHGLRTPISEEDFTDEFLSAGFSTAQIMDMVNSINRDQNDWISEEVIDRVF
ncbi:hypothetical protein MY8738_005205 [Beauveria namnaoensis]